MSKAIADALELSIERWEFRATRTPSILNTPNVADCPLCDMFFSNGGCYGCPVKVRTTFHHCKGTPYGYAAEAHAQYRTCIPSEKALNLELWKKHAAAEVEFLKSLRKKEDEQEA